MVRPKLSICIPTYNRARFLERLLEHLATDLQFPFSTEIVISDNCSSDDTKNVIETSRASGLQISYFRQERHVTLEENAYTALRRARGEYLVYLADDDLLDAGGTEQAIAFLDANRNVVACYAPWELYDDVEKKRFGKFFEVEADTIFNGGNIDELFDFIIAKHSFPEIGIYRAEIAWKIFIPRHFCYWAFACLAHFLDHGDVAFVARPFYLSVARSRVQRDRMQAGTAQAMADWDFYRGGLEYFVQMSLRRAGRLLTREQHLDIARMIDSFVVQRMKVALRLWVAVAKYTHAYDLFCRLALWLPPDDPLLAELRPRLPLHAAIQGLDNIIRSTSSIDRLVLLGIPNAMQLQVSMRQLGLGSDIQVAIDPAPPVNGDAQRSAVLVNSESDRSTAIELGYSPGFIFAQSDVLHFFGKS
jgi:glycosyltransferase involved in cell wall biosynthesis